MIAGRLELLLVLFIVVGVVTHSGVATSTVHVLKSFTLTNSRRGSGHKQYTKASRSG